MRYVSWGQNIDLNWKVWEKQNGEQQRKKEQRREGMKILQELGVSSKVVHFLQENANLQSKNEETIKKSFERGEIPLGFHDKLLWSEAASILNLLLPAKIKPEEVRLEELEKEEREAKQRLDKIEEEHRQIVEQIAAARSKIMEEIAAVQSQKKEIEAKIGSFQQIIASGYGNIVQFLAQPETELAMATKTKFENDFNEFAAIDDDSTSAPKLSLVFNTFGLSKNVIAKIGNIDGHEFLETDINALCDRVELTDLGTVKQLAYVQNMAKSGVYLAGQHEEHCPVCSATSAEDFKQLVKEHAARNEDVRVCESQLVKLGINGRAFLALTPQDISNLQIYDEGFNGSYSEAKRYFERFHHEATTD